MSSRIAVACGVIALAGSMAGCATWVTVEQVTEQNDAKGLRYSLAAPYLLMKPANDGTMTYEWLMLPDESRTYAIETHSVLSTRSLEAKIEHALLTKVVAKPDASALPSELLTQAGVVLEAEKKAEAKEAEAEATRSKTESAALKTALQAAQANERTTKLAYDQAKEKATFLRDKNADAKTQQDADLEEIRTRLAHEAAEAEVARLTQLVALIPGKDFANANTSTSGSGDGSSSGPSAWGPILFRVVQTGDTVTLRAVELQKKFPTYGKPPKALETNGSDAKLTGAWDPGTSTLKVTASAKVEINDKRFVLNAGKKPFTTAVTWAAAGKDMTYTVTFNPRPPSGECTLQVQYKLEGADGNPDKSATVTFIVP